MDIQRFQKGGTWLTVRWQVPENELESSLAKLKERFPDEFLRVVDEQTTVLRYAYSQGLIDRLSNIRA